MILEIELSAEELWTEIQGKSGPSKKLFMKTIKRILDSNPKNQVFTLFGTDACPSCDDGRITLYTKFPVCIGCRGMK